MADTNARLNANINLGWGIPGFYAGATDADGDFDGAIDADIKSVGGRAR